MAELDESTTTDVVEGAANAQEGGAEGNTDTPQEGQISQGGEAAAEGTGEGQQKKPAKPSGGRKNAKGNPGGDQAGDSDSSQEGKEPQGGMPDAAEADKQLNELVKAYSKLYPKCRQFHVTSDLMVFLDNDLNAAEFHQRSLPNGQVETLKRAD